MPKHMFELEVYDSGLGLAAAGGVMAAQASLVEAAGVSAATGNPVGWIAAGAFLAVAGTLDILDALGIFGRDTPALPRQDWHRDHTIQVAYLGTPLPDAKPSVNVKSDGKPSDCVYYDNLCGSSAGQDTYACAAGPCCRAFGDNPVANCTRNCLIKLDPGCAKEAGITRSLCRDQNHSTCYNGCGENPLAPLAIPSCRQLLIP